MTGLCRPCAARRRDAGAEKRRLDAIQRYWEENAARKAELAARFGDNRCDRLAWCPPSMRDAYREVRRKLNSADEAKSLFVDEIGRQGRREVAENEQRMHARHLREVEQRY